MNYLLRVAYRLMQVHWFLVRPVTLGVRLLPVRDGTVLLVRHTYQDAWFLPGGGVKRNETLEQAIRREAAEECGADLQHLKFLGIFSHFYSFKSDHIVLFLSKEFTHTGQPDREIERMAYFPFEQLPRDMSPGSGRRIQEYLNGELPSWGQW